MSAVAALVFAAAALGGGGQAARLSVALYPQGLGGPVHTYSLRCAPPRGTVSRPARACRLLTRLAHPFAPVPRDAICTQLALGPQDAIVTGTLRGRRIWAHLRLRNGCEIGRWRRVAAIVPGFPAGP